jgi:hypothetical protein
LQAKPLVQPFGGLRVQRQEEEELQASPLVQPFGGLRVQRQEEEELQAKPRVQRRTDSSFETGPELEGRLAAQKGAGSPLSADVRALMEPRFGADFGGVRVHTGGEAVQMNKDLRAQAFTHGQDIYLGAGRYDPGTTAGKRLLAHELTHVVQQTGNQVQRHKQGAVAVDRAGPAIQRKLISRAERAFKTAVAQNAGYGAARDLVDKHVPEKDQKAIVTLRGKLARILKSPGPEKLLKDFIRAFLLRNYAEVLANPLKTRGRKFYLGKAKEQRNQYKSLVDKGVAAPETQTFLRSQGFAGGITVAGEELKVGPRIDVRATFIGGRILGKRVRAHLFIVYTTSTGRQYYFRGGPDGSSPPMTVADWGEYTPSTVDWDPSAPSETVLKGETGKGKLEGLIEATSVIDGMKVPYDPGGFFSEGENCNATAYTILKRAGVPTGKPSGRHPGWGHILGALTKGKEGALPEKEKDTGPGQPYQLKGAPKDKIQVYHDRAMIEKAVELPGGTHVGLFGNPKALIVRIKYGGENIGFVPKASVEERREAGRAFKINTDCDIYALTSMAKMGSLKMGDQVDVLDPDFAGGAASELIRIAYVDPITDEYRKGRVTDWYLEAV